MLSRYWSKPMIPLLIINSSINQQKASNLLRKLQKVDYKRAKALAVIIEVDNHMPVQIDKIAEFLEEKRVEFNLKLYGFCHTNVSLESYYLLSKADEIYTSPTSIFQLQRGVRYFDTEECLKNLGVEKKTTKTDPNVIGNFMDSFTSPNTAKYLNTKISEIAERIYKESIALRQQRKEITLDALAPQTMLGTQALSRGYADNVGTYEKVLKQLFPGCSIKTVRLRQKPSTRTLELLVASPIIIVLFMIKVLIKYTIIMWLYLKHKNKKQQK